MSFNKDFKESISSGKYDRKILKSTLIEMGLFLSEEEINVAIDVTKTQKSGSANSEFANFPSTNGKVTFGDILKKKNFSESKEKVSKTLSKVFKESSLLDFSDFLCLLFCINAVLMSVAVKKHIIPSKQAPISVLDGLIDSKGNIEADNLYKCLINIGQMRTLSQVKNGIFLFNEIDVAGEWKMVFSIYDVKKSGKVAMSEFRNGIIKVEKLLNLEEREMKYLGVIFDSEVDEMIDYKLFKALMLIGTCISSMPKIGEKEVNELVRVGLSKTVAKGIFDAVIIKNVLSYLGIVLTEEQVQLVIEMTKKQEKTGEAREEFKKNDLNGDNSLDVNELKKMNDVFTDKHIETIMERLDINKNGVLDYNEFICLLLIGNAILVKAGVSSSFVKPNQKTKMSVIDEKIRMNAKKTFDQENNIDLKALKEMLFEMNQLRTSEQILEGVKKYTTLEKNNKVKELFEYFDKDKNQKISLKELEIGYKEMGKIMKKKDLKRLMSLMDVNIDGYLQLSEFKVLILIGCCCSS